MSNHGDSKFIPDVKRSRDELCRPQTVSLSRFRQENGSKTEGETTSDQSIGKDFFPQRSNCCAKDPSPKQTDFEIENSTSTNELADDLQSSWLNGDRESARNQSEIANGRPSLRPKTVTIKSSNERRQRLVDMGAVSSQDAVGVVSVAAEVNQGLRIERALSPKPKANKCYICGREFLLSSLKIHEKQCAKKFKKENETQNTKKTRSGNTTSNLESREFKLNHAKNSPAVSSLVSKLPRKLKLEACYLCGREFFAHSLGIHETQCIKNWKANQRPEANQKCTSDKATADRPAHCDENKFPGMEQQKCLTEEEKETIEKRRSDEGKESLKCDKMGEEATVVRRQKVLKTTPCYLCGKELLPHSLKVHEKKCRSRKETEDERAENALKCSTGPSVKDGIISNNTFSGDTTEAVDKQLEESRNESLSENAKKTENPLVSSFPRTPKKPRTAICYICGQEFLKSSLAIHEKQCAGKNKMQAERGETKQSRDKRAPSRATPSGRKTEPPGLHREDTPPRKPKTQKCFICGKEILLSSLKIHEQQCQRKSEILKNINQQKLAQKGQQRNPRQGGGKPKTELCYLCGETFLTSSIKVHETQCEKKWNASNRT